jgi:hypothetical protein
MKARLVALLIAAACAAAALGSQLRPSAAQSHRAAIGTAPPTLTANANHPDGWWDFHSHPDASSVDPIE